jgi:hypothetical protein
MKTQSIWMGRTTTGLTGAGLNRAQAGLALPCLALPGLRPGVLHTGTFT